MKVSSENHERFGAAPNRAAPLVSVVIPTYNCARFLADAVDSVFRQSYTTLECIVVDDGSTDDTNDVLAKLTAKYPLLKTIQRANGGPSAARNTGLRLCSGEFVSFVDADDVLLPDKIALQVNFLNSHPDVGLVHSDYLIVSENLQPLAVFDAEMPPEMDPIDALSYRNWFNPLVALIRRTAIDKVGEFDEEFDRAEDWDYWIRCAKITRVSYMAGPVALYRRHGGQISQDYSRMKRACIRVAKKHFRENHRNFRTAMAGIELTYAKYLWKRHEATASFRALLRFGFQHGFGLHRGDIRRQFHIINQSQLKPL